MKTSALKCAKIFLRLLIVIPCFYASSCDQRQDSDTLAKDEQKAISEVSAARAKAFNEQDAAGIAVHFTDGGLLMAPGQPTLKGRQAVQSYYQAIFDIYNPILESGYDEVFVNGDLGYGRGFAKVTLVPKSGGDTLVSTSKYINIMKKQKDGTWKTTHDIWNGNEEEVKAEK